MLAHSVVSPNIFIDIVSVLTMMQPMMNPSNDWERTKWNALARRRAAGSLNLR